MKKKIITSEPDLLVIFYFLRIFFHCLLHNGPLFAFLFEPADGKSYNKTCANSEDSYQPAHPRSLVGVLADRVCFYSLQYWVDVHADLSLYWCLSYCRFCRALALIVCPFSEACK